MNILLINDNSSHNNWGAQATADAVKELLRLHIEGSHLTCIPWEWLRRRYRRIPLPASNGVLLEISRLRHGRAFVGAISREQEYFPKIADDFNYWCDEWQAGRGGPCADEFTNLAANADAVVYNGENSLYFNTLEGIRALFLLYFAKTRLKRPTISINHTIHLTLVWPLMNAMVRMVFPHLDAITTREPWSLRNLEELGVQNGRFVPDAVFSLAPDRSYDVKVEKWLQQNGVREQEFFCLSLSGLPTSAPRSNWDGEVAQLVRDLKKTGLQAVLVAKDSHCQFLKEVAKRTGSLFFGPEHDYQELWGLFRSAAFLVTGHYHYGIFASMVGCPFIPLSTNNHKMNGLCEALEWPFSAPHNITGLAMSRDTIVGQARELFERRRDLGRHLCRKADEFRLSSLQNAEVVSTAMRAKT